MASHPFVGIIFLLWISFELTTISGSFELGNGEPNQRHSYSSWKSSSGVLLPICGFTHPFSFPLIRSHVLRIFQKFFRCFAVLTGSAMPLICCCQTFSACLILENLYEAFSLCTKINIWVQPLPDLHMFCSYCLDQWKYCLIERRAFRRQNVPGPRRVYRLHPNTRA